MKIIITESQFNAIIESNKTKKSLKKKKESDVELDEQDAADTSAGGGGAAATPTLTVSTNAGVSKGYPKVTKWDERPNPTKRGKANPLGKSGEKWQSGLTRGVSNNLF